MAARLADGTEAANLRTDSPPPTPSLSVPPLPPLHNPVAADTTEASDDRLVLRDEEADTAAAAVAIESIVPLGVGLNLLVDDGGGGGGGDDNGIGDSITNSDTVEQKKKKKKKKKKKVRDEKTSDNKKDDDDDDDDRSASVDRTAGQPTHKILCI